MPTVAHSTEALEMAEKDAPTVSSAPPPPMNIDQAPEYLELQARFFQLEQEFNLAKSSGLDARPLQEKVKFLESKLLEYEILQEEISTLGQLKIENEKLKSDLVRLERDLSSFTGTPPPAGTAAPAPGIEPSAMHDPTKTLEGDPTLGGLLEKIEGLVKPKDG